MDAFLANIEILPEYQGHGLGAALIGGIERLGFVITGETETHGLVHNQETSS